MQRSRIGPSRLLICTLGSSRDSRGLPLEASRGALLRTPPVHRSGRSVNTQFAGGLRTQIALGSVYGNAVGGGFAAVNHMGVHRSQCNLCARTLDKVCIHTAARSVYGRGPQKGLL